MKAVMLSLRPQWCEKIFNGSKSIEVRKSRPSIPTPFKVYVYQTKHNGGKAIVSEVLNSVYGGGKVIGSFVCDRVEEYEGEFWDDDTYERIQEPWEPSDFAEYGEYEYDTIGENGEFYGKGIELSKQSCLSWNELRKYVGQGLKDFYGWHITEPKLFDKPRELREFYTKCDKTGDCECEDCLHLQVVLSSYPCDDDVYTWCGVDNKKPISRPPQSYCFVETDEK